MEILILIGAGAAGLLVGGAFARKQAKQRKAIAEKEGLGPDGRPLQK